MNHRKLVVFLALVMLSCCAPAGTQQHYTPPKNLPEGIDTPFVPKNHKIQWYDADEMSGMVNTGVPVLVYFYLTWCPACAAFERDTLGDSDLAQYVNSKFYAVKIDAEKSTIAKESGLREFPAIVLLDPVILRPDGTTNLEDVTSRAVALIGYRSPTRLSAELEEFVATVDK